MRFAPLFSSFVGFGLLSAALAENPAPIDLGRKFEPAAGTQVRWTVHNEMNGGTFVGVRNGVPGNGDVTKTEDRVQLTTYASPDAREVKIESGMTKATEKWLDIPEITERKNPLAGVAVKGTRKDGAWTFSLAEGTPAPDQKQELEKLGRRANAEVPFFQGVKAGVGQTFDIDVMTFLKNAGFEEATEAKGAVKGTLKEIKELNGEKCAVVDITVNVNAKTAQPGTTSRFVLECKGTVTQGLDSALTMASDMEGTLRLSGTMANAKGTINPFSFNSPLKSHSERQIVKK